MTNYWDLAEKDVVNIKNGEVLGKFDDVEIDTRIGKITAFYIDETKPKRIRWEEILKIGLDVIIVNVDEDINNKAIKDMLE